MKIIKRENEKERNKRMMQKRKGRGGGYLSQGVGTVKVCPRERAMRPALT